MGNAFSMLPAWLRGAEDPDGATEPEDDKNAGISAPSGPEAVALGHKSWMAAYEKKNFTVLSNLYARDCKVCPPGSRSAHGRTECSQGWESLLQGGIEKVVFTDTTVEDVNGSLMADTANYIMYGKELKELDKGKHIMIWRKIREKWFIHLHIFNSNLKREKTAREYVVEATFRWELHYFMRDYEALGKLYTDNCTLSPPAWPKVEGRLPVQRFWARFPSMGIDHIERIPMEASSMGDGMTVTEGRYTMFDYKGGVIDIGKMVVIYKKQKDDRWCIHMEIFNSDAAVPTVLTEVETNN